MSSIGNIAFDVNMQKEMEARYKTNLTARKRHVTENAIRAMADLGIHNAGIYSSPPSEVSQVVSKSRFDYKTITTPRKQEIMDIIADAKKDTNSTVSKDRSERRRMLQIKGHLSSPKARFNEDNSQQASEIRENS